MMGNATNVCSDKTGTLTQNKMAVVAGMVESIADFSDLLRLAVVIGALPPHLSYNSRSAIIADSTHHTSPQPFPIIAYMRRLRGRVILVVVTWHVTIKVSLKHLLLRIMEDIALLSLKFFYIDFLELALKGLVVLSLDRTRSAPRASPKHLLDFISL